MSSLLIKKAAVLREIKINCSERICNRPFRRLQHILLITIVMSACVASAERLKIDDGVWVFLGAGQTVNMENKGRIANIGFIETSQSGIFINAGISHNHAQQVLTEISDISHKKILEAIVIQGDRKFALGASSLRKSGVTTYAHPKIAIQMNERCVTCIKHLEDTLGKEMKYTQVDTPRNIAEMELLAHYPLKDIAIIDHGDTVSQGALMIYHIPSGILFAGDVVFSGIVPSLKEANFDSWKKSLELLQELPISAIIPGTGPILTKSAIVTSISYLDALEINTQNLYSDNQDLLSATQNGGLSQFEDWILYNENHANNVMYRYLEIEKNELSLED